MFWRVYLTKIDADFDVVNMFQELHKEGTDISRVIVQDRYRLVIGSIKRNQYFARGFPDPDSGLR